MIHRHMQRNERNPCRQTKPPTDMSFRGSEASRGIFPSCKLYLVLVILATWEDPSTPFHFGRDDMSVGGFIHPHGLYSFRCHGDESSPLHCVIPFIHTGYIGDVSGTAHRPFPTYFNGRIHMNNVGHPNNCQLSIVNSEITVNCQLSTVHCQLKHRPQSPDSLRCLGAVFYDPSLSPSIALRQLAAGKSLVPRP